MFSKLPVKNGTAAGVSLFTLDEMKDHLKRDDDDDNTYIQTLIDAADSYLGGVDGILGLAFVAQGFIEKANSFPASDVFRLDLMPIVSIDSIKYYDEGNNLQTFLPGNYSFHDALGFSYIKLSPDTSWPSTYERDDAVEVTYTAGYGAAGDSVPSAIRHAAKLLIGSWYENREAAAPVSFSMLPMGAQSLLRPFKRAAFGD